MIQKHNFHRETMMIYSGKRVIYHPGVNWGRGMFRSSQGAIGMPGLWFRK